MREAATTHRVMRLPGENTANAVGMAAAGKPTSAAQIKVWCMPCKAKDMAHKAHSTPTIRRSARR